MIEFELVYLKILNDVTNIANEFDANANKQRIVYLTAQLDEYYALIETAKKTAFYSKAVKDSEFQMRRLHLI